MKSEKKLTVFGRFVTELMTKHRMNNFGMASLIEISHSQLSGIKYGYRCVSNQVIDKIAENFDLSAAEKKELSYLRKLERNKRNARKKAVLKNREDRRRQEPEFNPLAAVIAYECTGNLQESALWLGTTIAKTKLLLQQAERNYRCQA